MASFITNSRILNDHYMTKKYLQLYFYKPVMRIILLPVKYEIILKWTFKKRIIIRREKGLQVTLCTFQYKKKQLTLEKKHLGRKNVAWRWVLKKKRKEKKTQKGAKTLRWSSPSKCTPIHEEPNLKKPRGNSSVPESNPPRVQFLNALAGLYFDRN